MFGFQRVNNPLRRCPEGEWTRVLLDKGTLRWVKERFAGEGTLRGGQTRFSVFKLLH